MTTEERLQAVGLTVAPGDLPELEAAILDLDRLALTLRGLRPYTEEPLSAFRLKRA